MAADPVTQMIADLQRYAGDAFLRADMEARLLPFAALAHQPEVYGRSLTEYRDVETPDVPPLPAPPSFLALPDFGTSMAQVKALVDSLQDSWLMQYFPAALPSGLDPLISLILSGVIVTPAMQEIAWERAKAQGLRDAMRMEDTLVTQWASRGFSMPGGVVNTQLLVKQQEVLHMNAGFAAQQAIKALDLQVDAAKFAAEIGTKLRLGLIEALTRLVDSYARLPAAAANYISAISNAQAAMYSAISEYYRIVMTKSEISLKANVANADNDMKYIQVAGQFIGSQVRSQVDAATAAANVYSQSAAAALSGLTGVASINVTA